MNYPYFLLFKNRESFNKFKRISPDVGEEAGQLYEKINNYSYFISLNSLEGLPEIYEGGDIGIIKPIKMKDYISLCFEKCLKLNRLIYIASQILHTKMVFIKRQLTGSRHVLTNLIDFVKKNNSSFENFEVTYLRAPEELEAHIHRF